MKFINNTIKSIKIRTGDLNSGYEWPTVRPGQIIDIPKHIGEAYELEPYKHKPTAEDQPNAEGSHEGSREEYLARLVAINGVGRKTADQVFKKYTTIESLTKAIAAGKEIHTRDDVDAKIKEEFR
jgi:ERCC4-type nuclease